MIAVVSLLAMIQKPLKLPLLIFLTLLLQTRLEARVFDFGSEPHAAYLKVGMLGSRLASDSFGFAGDQVQLANQSFSYLNTGEIGWTMQGSTLGFKLGVQGLNSASLLSDGSNLSGTSLYTSVNQVGSFAPIIGFMVNFYQTKKSRASIELSAGQATVSIVQNYQLTPEGQSELGVVAATAIESSRAIGQLFYEALAIYEILMVDTTTFVLEAGYRDMKVTNLKVLSDVDGPSGSYLVGDTLRHADGTARVFNLSGWVVQANFRFYLDF